MGSGKADGSCRIFMSGGGIIDCYPSPSADETRATRLARFKLSIGTTEINTNIFEDSATDTTSTKEKFQLFSFYSPGGIF